MKKSLNKLAWIWYLGMFLSVAMMFVLRFLHSQSLVAMLSFVYAGTLLFFSLLFGNIATRAKRKWKIITDNDNLDEILRMLFEERSWSKESEFFFRLLSDEKYVSNLKDRFLSGSLASNWNRRHNFLFRVIAKKFCNEALAKAREAFAPLEQTTEEEKEYCFVLLFRRIAMWFFWINDGDNLEPFKMLIKEVLDKAGPERARRWLTAAIEQYQNPVVYEQGWHSRSLMIISRHDTPWRKTLESVSEAPTEFKGLYSKLLTDLGQSLHSAPAPPVVTLTA
jgi:hypothetical protein